MRGGPYMSTVPLWIGDRHHGQGVDNPAKGGAMEAGRGRFSCRRGVASWCSPDRPLMPRRGPRRKCAVPSCQKRAVLSCADIGTDAGREPLPPVAGTSPNSTEAVTGPRNRTAPLSCRRVGLVRRGQGRSTMPALKWAMFFQREHTVIAVRRRARTDDDNVVRPPFDPRRPSRR